MNLQELNDRPETDFVSALGGVFEHSPWVAEAVAGGRPFASVSALHQAMVQAVEKAGVTKQLALIRAHPDLAGKAARAGHLTDASTSEQKGAGLDRLDDAEYERFHSLNDAYKQRFDFPFILAVRGFDGKGHDKHSILASFETRLQNTPEQEISEALRQIARIAELRLGDMLTS
ncbi:2-oxo-4-hydroxy-4-carboxy-5-ureidoimidazoline decarboxylase [Pseudochrobactrum algeriensis]|uniref:2-oxo-4-hydroxy-4-carboxy-5-ureidoimidazoline decarboxylase n=1 Tax=Pseudochrobactrum algeriensis TaxID=2834768 RepID=UPI001BCC990C|nr:2-oxo-4-hydroxy-4-carboxy-5-ureidoimidazoline decarboxylase [Pseudochrobactrum algeriensis]MBX8813616.1 2-oxo-4-hydroxy-4-carboxy-5-ureidoimidazoline decarboxylase [Ochrobactrum sp. MR34]QVQ37552.1 2-oxo-4-hydroxy-4-carboxy-5-ureidoimidazoline decarboxylase [Pseudochrobactrum algeriensis]QVQ40773.1 2-oxo-4-hydroxy-4-carboxy-5-ureidoimidazoline decarboxylase [Pseudochrobactrum algeriensis]QVQ44695.1 2-oxo-4-hydroxy-4-carboxy-5-ureidoimidazoline decarboxylase [Pseudochrobactrum algeriensis]